MTQPLYTLYRLSFVLDIHKMHQKKVFVDCKKNHCDSISSTEKPLFLFCVCRNILFLCFHSCGAVVPTTIKKEGKTQWAIYFGVELEHKSFKHTIIHGSKRVCLPLTQEYLRRRWRFGVDLFFMIFDYVFDMDTSFKIGVCCMSHTSSTFKHACKGLCCLLGGWLVVRGLINLVCFLVLGGGG